MTPDELALIRARAEKATEGPWKVWAMSVLADPVGNSNLYDGLLIADTTDPHRGLRTFNADFIAHARTDVPALVAEVERLQREVARTVGDLCANDLGKRIRVESDTPVEGALLTLDCIYGRDVVLSFADRPGAFIWPAHVPVTFLDEPASAPSEPATGPRSHEQASQVLADPDDSAESQGR